MELLCPAGNLAKLKTAILYGADAVYLAGQKFGLRAAADNFTPAGLLAAIVYAHAHRTKVYITINAFLYEQDWAELDEYLFFLTHSGCDGVIVADLGVIKRAVHYDLPVHVSTQASVLNADQARFYGDLGAKRIILGREVPIATAAQIKAETGLEVELFIHGAMCMAYSGQCVISNYTSGRDSNKGGCIQSCRHNFLLHPLATSNAEQHLVMEKSFISSKDLSGIRLLPDFLAFGIDSIKVEGRMKSLLYLATVTKAYRNGLNALVQGAEPDWANLEANLEGIAHRGYTSGSLVQMAGLDSVFQQGMKEQANHLAGSVLARGVKKIYLQAANLLQPGTELEFLLPSQSHNWENKVGEFI